MALPATVLQSHVAVMRRHMMITSDAHSDTLEHVVSQIVLSVIVIHVNPNYYVLN
jgi:hypothetical protein